MENTYKQKGGLESSSKGKGGQLESCQTIMKYIVLSGTFGVTYALMYITTDKIV